MPADSFGLLTVKEVAQILHCSKAHVSNVLAGKVHGCIPIPAVRLGRRTLVRHESLRAWIECNERSAANDNTKPAANDNLNTSPERGRKRG